MGWQHHADCSGNHWQQPHGVDGVIAGDVVDVGRHGDEDDDGNDGNDGNDDG